LVCVSLGALCLTLCLTDAFIQSQNVIFPLAARPGSGTEHTLSVFCITRQKTRQIKFMFILYPANKTIYIYIVPKLCKLNNFCLVGGESSVEYYIFRECTFRSKCGELRKSLFIYYVFMHKERVTSFFLSSLSAGAHTQLFGPRAFISRDCAEWRFLRASILVSSLILNSKHDETIFSHRKGQK